MAKWRSQSTDAAIVGVGGTRLYRNEDVSLTGLCAEAALEAVEDAALTVADIGGVVVIPDAPNKGAMHAEGYDEVTTYDMVEALGLGPVQQFDLDIHMLVVGAIANACQAVSAGVCENVLVVRGLFQPPGVNYAIRPDTVAAGHGQFMEPYGIGYTGAVKHALTVSRFLHERSMAREDLYPVVRLARDNAKKNPFAYWRDARTPTVTEYLTRPTPFEPLSILDCDLPVSGATAFVVTSARRAIDLPHQAYVSGFLPCSQGEHLFDVSGVRRSDVDVCQLYDGFSYFVLQWLEKLGYCRFGESAGFIANGNGDPDGALPLNTFGGCLGEGRLHGGGHVREAALQMMGRAGSRQIDNARHCIVQNGLIDHGWIMMLSSSPR